MRQQKKHHQCGTWHLVTFLEQTHNVRSKISTIKTTIMVMLNNRTYRKMTFSHREILHTKQRAYIRSRRYHANTTNVKMHTANTWNNFYQQKLCHFFATTKKWQWKRWKIDQNIPPSALTKNPIFFLALFLFQVVFHRIK